MFLLLFSTLIVVCILSYSFIQQLQHVHTLIRKQKPDCLTKQVCERTRKKAAKLNDNLNDKFYTCLFACAVSCIYLIDLSILLENNEC